MLLEPLPITLRLCFRREVTLEIPARLKATAILVAMASACLRQKVQPPQQRRPPRVTAQAVQLGFGFDEDD
jgi:hypothetical protein